MATQKPNSQWYPSARELATDDGLRRSLQTVLERVYSLQDAQNNSTTSVSAAIQGLKAATTPAAIKLAITANSSQPLDITGLVGRTRSNQYAYVPQFSALPPLTDPSATSGPGTLITVSKNPKTAGLLYRFNEPFDTFNPVQALGTSLTGTHSDRIASFPATDYEVGTLFFETDRTVFYIVLLDGGGNNIWVFGTGIYTDVEANRPADLGPDDIWFRFHATDLGLTYIWNGTAWEVDTELGVILADTHANRLANFNPADYPNDILFYETDRTVFYINLGSTWTFATGTYNAAVASQPSDLGASDANFRFYATDAGVTYLWNGSAWILTGSVGVVAADTHANRIASFPTSLFPPHVLFYETDRHVTYVASGADWIYQSGQMEDLAANVPTDLSATDYGFLFIATDTNTMSWWDGAAFQPLGGGSVPGAWSAWTPTVSASTGTFTTTLIEARYFQLGKIVFFEFFIAATVTSPVDTFLVSMPVIPRVVNAGTSFLGGGGGGGGGNSLIQNVSCLIDPHSQLFNIVTATYNAGTVAYTFPNGSVVLSFSGTYEAL